MSFRQSIFWKNFSMYRQSSAYTVLKQHGFLNNTVYFGTLICPFSILNHSSAYTVVFPKSQKKRISRGPPVHCMYIQIILLRKEQFICLFVFVFFFYTVQKTQLMMVAKNTAMKLAQHYYVCLLLTHTYCPFIKTHDPEM